MPVRVLKKGAGIGLRPELVLTMRYGDVSMHVLVLLTSFIHFICLVCDRDTHGVAHSLCKRDTVTFLVHTCFNSGVKWTHSYTDVLLIIVVICLSSHVHVV